MLNDEFSSAQCDNNSVCGHLALYYVTRNGLNYTLQGLFQSWLTANKLTLNVKKTKFMLIGSLYRLSQVNNDFTVQVNSKSLDPSSYGTHSFRSGGATRAANSGIGNPVFQRHGRWKSVAATDG